MTIAHKLTNKLRNATLWTVSIALALSTNMVAYAEPSAVSLTLGDGRVDETTTYTLGASTVNTSTALQCIELDLGSNVDGTGAISGLDTSSSTFNSSTLVPTPGNWSVDNTGSATHQLRATYATGEAPNASGNVVWGSVVNGDTADTTFYGVMTTYSDNTCSTSVESVTIQYVYTEGQLVTLTVDPSLTFDIYSVASSQAAAGSTTTVATTDGTVPFGQITTASNGVAAHDIDVSTNASSGYNLYLRYTADLTNTNDGVSTITDHTGTYASPSAFAAPGTEAFGYHTNDTEPGFGASNFAGFVTTVTGDSVMENNSPTPGTETTRVTYQVGIASTTEAGVYETTLIYTLVPTF